VSKGWAFGPFKRYLLKNTSNNILVDKTPKLQMMCDILQTFAPAKMFTGRGKTSKTHAHTSLQFQTTLLQK